MELSLIDRFIDMENELNLYDKKYKDFPYWMYIRKTVYSGIVCEKHNNGAAFTETLPSLKSLLSVLPKLIFDKKYSLKKFKGEYEFLFFCHPRRVWTEECYQSIYSDVYANSCGNSLTVERPYELRHETPCYTENIMYLDKMFYARAIYLKLTGSQNKKLRNDLEHDIQQIVTVVEKRFDHTVDKDKLLNRIEYLYKRYRYTKKYFYKFFKSIKPKAIVEVVHYNFENRVVTEVAKNLGIPVVELQHGLIGKYHLSYNYGELRDGITMPDYLLTFSDFWKDTLRIPESVTKVKTSGFAYFEQTLEKYPSKEERKTIIFLSSGTVGKLLHKVAIELAELLEQQNAEWKVVYKLHPGEYKDWKERYPELINANVTVIDTPDVNLYQLFSESIVQVGVYSTAIFEGLGYNLQTYILSHGETENVSMLLEAGDATLITSARDIWEQMKNNRERSIDISKYWEVNAYSKTKAFLDELNTKKES